MRTKLLMIGATLALQLVLVAGAVAATPAQNAYSGISPNTVATPPNSPTLPFTGVNVGLMVVVALALVVSGLVLRRAAASRT
jgi:hypothetical protein